MLPIQPAYPFPLPERKERHGVLFAHQSCAGEETREGEDSSIKATATNDQAPGETMVQTTSAFALCRGSVGGERHILRDDGDAASLKLPDTSCATLSTRLCCCMKERTSSLPPLPFAVACNGTSFPGERGAEATISVSITKEGAVTTCISSIVSHRSFLILMESERAPS
jgi:hypothetical protein